MRTGNPRVKRLVCMAHWIMRVFSLTYKPHGRKEKNEA